MRTPVDIVTDKIFEITNLVAEQYFKFVFCRIERLDGNEKNIIFN